MCISPIHNNFVYNLQRSQKLAPRIFPPLPYSEENSHFVKKFQFLYSDLNDSEFIQQCETLVERRHCYVTHRNDVGQFSTPFRIKLSPDDKLQTQNFKKVFFSSSRQNEYSIG